MSKTSIRLIVGSAKHPIRLSFFNGFEPKAAPGQTEKKYGTAVLISKKDIEGVAAFKKAVDDVLKAAAFKGKTKLPLRDGDSPDEKCSDEYKGHYFFNANNKSRPTLVDKNGKVIIDPEELYSGAYAIVSVNLFDFDTSGNKGVGVALNHVMKVKDGEKLAGGPSAEEDFAEFIGKIADEDDDISSLM